MDGEINRAFQKKAELMMERAKREATPHPGPLPSRGGEGGRKVLALIPLNLDGFLFSADYQSGKKAEITSRVAANFVGWEKDHARFGRELEKVTRALRTGEGGRERPPPAKLSAARQSNERRACRPSDFDDWLQSQDSQTCGRCPRNRLKSPRREIKEPVLATIR